MQWFAERGFSVTGIDRNPEALVSASQYGTTVQADIENGPWPLLLDKQSQQFDVVVVTNYLWRARLPTILHSVAPGGLLLYETFARGNEDFGRPSNPDFLLHPGELLNLCQGMLIIAYEYGFVPQPARCVQRIAACMPALLQPTLQVSEQHLLSSR